MTRQERRIVNGALTGASIFFLFDFVMQWLEHSERGQRLSLQSYDGKRAFRHTLLGAAVGGAAGLVFDHLVDDDPGPFNHHEFLRKEYQKESLKANPLLETRLKAEHERVSKRLNILFKSYLAEAPTHVGSFANGVALNNCDSDIILPFHKGSYSTLQEMYEDVFETISNEFGSFAVIEKNSRTIGITYRIHNSEIHFDIIPGREIGNYSQDGNLNLYTRPQSWFQSGSRRKTNIDSQLNLADASYKTKRITELMKIYRDRNDLRIPSVIIQNCVVEAKSEGYLQHRRSDVKNLERAILHLKIRLSSGYIADTANSNNNLLDKMTDRELIRAIEVLESDYDLLREDPRHVKEMFLRYSY